MSPTALFMNSPCVISPAPECFAGVDILKLAEFPHRFSNLWSEGCYGWKGQVEAIGFTSNRENSEPKPGLHLWRNCRNQRHHQGHERYRSGGSHMVSLVLLLGLCRRQTVGSDS